MSLRPIDLNPKEVQAIQSGQNLQIRRKVKPKSGGEIRGWSGNAIAMEEIPSNEPDTQHFRTVVCPYGQVGDRLFVREAFGKKVRNIGGTPHEQYAYKADNPNEVKFLDCNGKGYPIKWKAAPRMPRIASRLILEIQEISVVPKNPISTANQPNPFMWAIKFIVIQGGAA